MEQNRRTHLLQRDRGAEPRSPAQDLERHVPQRADHAGELARIAQPQWHDLKQRCGRPRRGAGRTLCEERGQQPAACKRRV